MIEGPAGIVAFGFVPGYERKGFYSPEEVLSRLGQTLVDFDGDCLDVVSMRYRVFAESLVCCTCGLEGRWFAKERNAKFRRALGVSTPTTNNWHFNLYGLKDGHLVMFTKDHIVPKSRGGSEFRDNFQTMCGPCNVHKSDRRDDESHADYIAYRHGRTAPKTDAKRLEDRKRRRDEKVARRNEVRDPRTQDTLWGGVLLDANGGFQRIAYVRRWLVLRGGEFGAASLYCTSGLMVDPREWFAHGVFIDVDPGASVKTHQRAPLFGAHGFGQEGEARAFLMKTRLGWPAEPHDPDLTDEARAERAKERKRAEARRDRANDVECRAAVAAGLRLHETHYGAYVGQADRTCVKSAELCRVRPALVFQGGCHGDGVVFLADEITHPRLGFARGVFHDRDRQPLHIHRQTGQPQALEMKVSCAVAGFEHANDAYAYLTQGAA